MADDVYLFSKRCASANRSAREAGHLQDLHGPGIVALKGRTDGNGLVLAGAACSLADVLLERGPLPDEQVRAVGAAAAAALARVHEGGLVHGDVKPANLLLSHDGELWLADFDAASPAGGQPLERFSPGRLPPGAPALPAADIVALALTLVELSTGALLDACVAWQAADLRRLGCSPALSAEIALMLGGAGLLRTAGSPSDPDPPGDAGPNLTAHRVARMFEQGTTGALPLPVAATLGSDPTPTVEFMPVRPSQDAAAATDDAAAEQPSRWWRRLVASWRPAAPTRHR